MTDKLQLRITGMDCADCAAKIEGAVSKLKGVSSAQVLLSSSKLVVRPSDGEVPAGLLEQLAER